MRGPAWFAQKAGKRDKSHATIRNGLRKLGYVVADLAGATGGVPDLAVRDVTWPAGRWEFLEVKEPGGELTLAQVELHAEWRAKRIAIGVVVGLSEAVAWLKNGRHGGALAPVSTKSADGGPAAEMSQPGPNLSVGVSNETTQQRINRMARSSVVRNREES